MKIFLVLFFVIFSFSVLSEECVEKNMAIFKIAGVVVPAAEVYEEGGECDNFGGAIAYTPKYNIFIFVNFNIPVTVELDEIEKALEESVTSYDTLFKLAQKKYSFISREIMGHLSSKDDGDILLARSGDLFISEKTIDDNVPVTEVFKLIFGLLASKTN